MISRTLLALRHPATWRGFLLLQAGFALYGLALGIMVRTAIGVSPWLVFQLALALYIPITPGQSTQVVGAVVVLLAWALGEKLGWGTLLNVIFIGWWLDLFLPFLPQVPPFLWFQIPYFLLGVAVLGLATAVYLKPKAGAGPRDALMQAVTHHTRWPVRYSRMALELIVLAIGWAMGGPVGLGTLIYALTVGPSVQAGFRLLNVSPHRKVAEPLPLPGAD